MEWALFNKLLLEQGNFRKTYRKYLVAGRWGWKGTGKAAWSKKMLTKQPHGWDSQVTLKCAVLLCLAQQSLNDYAEVNAVGKGQFQLMWGQHKISIDSSWMSPSWCFSCAACAVCGDARGGIWHAGASFCWVSMYQGVQEKSGTTAGNWYRRRENGTAAHRHLWRKFKNSPYV